MVPRAVVRAPSRARRGPVIAEILAQGQTGAGAGVGDDERAREMLSRSTPIDGEYLYWFVYPGR